MNVSNLANLFHQNGVLQQNKPLGLKEARRPADDLLQRMSNHMLAARKGEQDPKKRFDTLELSLDALNVEPKSPLDQMPTELLEFYYHVFQFAGRMNQLEQEALTEYRNQLSAFDQTIQDYQDMLDGKAELPQELGVEDVAALLEQTRADRERFLREGAKTLNPMGDTGLDISYKGAYQLLGDPEGAKNGDFRWRLDPDAGDIYGQIDRALEATRRADGVCREGASRVLAELRRRGLGEESYYRPYYESEGASFRPYMDRLMDTLDAAIDSNRDFAAVRPWAASTFRTDYIDREKVCRAFQSALA